MIVDSIFDLTVDAWFAEGLMTRLEKVSKQVVSVVSAAAVALVTAASMSTIAPLRIGFEISPHTTTLPARETEEENLQRIHAISASLGEQLSTLGSRNHSVTNPERYARAQRAIAALAARQLA